MVDADVAPRNRQTERRSEAERRLLEAAAELISESGPGSLTLAEIGRRAGYSRGLATHHFGSKGALIEQLVGVVTTQFRTAVVAADHASSPVTELRDMVSTYFGILTDFQPINRARIVLWADAVATRSPELRPAMLAMDAEFREEIADRVEAGIARGEFSDVNADGFATSLIALLRGIALQYILDPDLDLEAAREEALRFVIARLSQ